MKKDREAIEWLLAKTKTLHNKLIVLIVGTTINAVSTVVFAMLCRNVIDYAIKKNIKQAITMSVYLLVLIVLQFILKFTLNALQEYTKAKISVLLRKSRLDELLKKEYSDIQSVHSGDLMNRFFSDVQIISDGVTTILPQLFSMSAKLVCAVIVLIVLEPVFAGIFIVCGLLLLVVVIIFRKKMKYLHKNVQENQGKVHAFFQETISNLLIVRVFRNEKSVLQRCDQLQDNHFRALMKRGVVSVTANSGFSFIFQLGYLFSLAWGAKGLYYGTMTYGTLTAILQLVGQIQAPIVSLSGVIPRYYGVIASSERLMEIDEFSNEEEQESTEVKHIDSIDFQNVEFSYGRTDVLKNASFHIDAGDIVALTGLSGGGKSTIFLLLLGIYKKQKGKMFFTNDGMHFVPSKSTRTLFTYVPQENGLFSGTIRENLLMAKEDASYEEINEALRVACAKEFVDELPEGLNTYLGERGTGLSEGQRQRLAIARAVLSPSQIMLLDEATSALDGNTEKNVLKNISDIRKKTCLIVTHREAALHICNKQIILEDGVTSCVDLDGEL